MEKTLKEQVDSILSEQDARPLEEKLTSMKQIHQMLKGVPMTTDEEQFVRDKLLGKNAI